MNGSKNKKIAIIIGTKAELIKCMPIMLELKKRGEDYWFIHTGQHSLKEVCEEFILKKPDFVLSKAPKISTKFWSRINKNSLIWSLRMVLKIRRLVKKLKPKYIIYHGDTMSTAAASIASSKLLNSRKKWKNVHLEAGLRSGSLLEPFPEEISRQICDNFSDILLSVSDLTDKNLKRKNFKEIKNVGNTIVDSALISYAKAKKEHKITKGDYVLINIHRHENLKDEKRMKKIVDILKNIEIKAIWPLHDNTYYHLKKYELMDEIKKIDNLEITSLKSYSEFIFLIANCKYLITDGGSIQEESLVFKKPCILLRKKTERQEGLKIGINFLTKLNLNYSKKIIKDIEENKIKVKSFKNPYGKKGVSKKIVDILK